jgi:subtilase family serine protease
LASTTNAAAGQLLTPHVPDSVSNHVAQPSGQPDPNQRLTLAIALPMHDPAGLDAVLRALYTPGSPRFHHYLSVREYTARFAPSAQDYAAAVAFFRTQGLHIIATSANRAMIDADAQVATVERVFHTKLRLYRTPGESRAFLAPDREPSLDLAVPVLHVVGLGDEEQPRPRIVGPQTVASGTGSGPGGTYFGSDIRAAYYGAGPLTGAGQSLGLMELAGWNAADVTLYFTTVNQTLSVPINGISTDGTAVSCPRCDDAEQAVDIEYAASMAPGLAQIQVYVGHSAESVLNRMASDNTSKQLSTSWGWGNDFATDDPIFREMAAQGQTFLTASGDNGTLKASGPWPEEDANLTAVGGTTLVTAGPGAAWVSETAWFGSAGGPSLNRHIIIPSWQAPFINATNAGSTKLRNVPDIGGDAAFDNFVCFEGGCGGGFGGTSFASPIWAAMIAMVNQKAALAGHAPVGFLNPALYAAARGTGYASVLHDITSGSNGTYAATIGYDLVTGLGSPVGPGLVALLAGQP